MQNWQHWKVSCNLLTTHCTWYSFMKIQGNKLHCLLQKSWIKIIKVLCLSKTMRQKLLCRSYSEFLMQWWQSKCLSFSIGQTYSWQQKFSALLIWMLVNLLAIDCNNATILVCWVFFNCSFPDKFVYSVRKLIHSDFSFKESLLISLILIKMSCYNEIQI